MAKFKTRARAVDMLGRQQIADVSPAISVREAARLQTFPDDFAFVGSLNSMASQIGNAAPVLLVSEFGRQFYQHFNKKNNKRN